MIRTWQDEGIWTAHDPLFPGAYGIGKTKELAEADLVEALKTMVEYERDVGNK